MSQMTQTIPQSHSDANYLVKNHLESFLDYFNLELNNDSKKYSGVCPIHNNSDNQNAFIVYKNTGIWLCNTHHCHETFGKSAAGLIRALLSVYKRGWTEDNGKPTATIAEAIAFIFSFLNKKTSEVILERKQDESSIEKNNFIRQVKLLKPVQILGTRDSFRQQCKIPSSYYLKRGYSSNVLDKYDVGIMQNPKSYFFNKTVVPIYDIYYQYIIGYTARVNFEKCLVCGAFHHFSDNCIDKQESYGKFTKWEHNHGFRKESTLYNYWYARDCINKNHRIILVEGPSDIWKLEMADICYGVAIFGSNLSTNQINLIKKSYIKDIWVVGDNDEAGEKASLQMERVLGNDFNYHKIELKSNDLGDMNIEDIRNIFK